MKNTIAVIFDFDDTLASDSTSGFLNSLNIDVPAFWREEVQPLISNGWDPVPAYFYKMIELSNNGVQITKDKLANWGKEIQFYNGAAQIFQRIKNHASSINKEIEIEFFLISSGIGEILKNTKIAKNFTEIWASDFHYDSSDGNNSKILFPKNIISFTDKTRFLFYISKGLIGDKYRGKPFEVNRKIDKKDYYIPFDQMIFVGDGYTDIPCFSLVKDQGGIPIGVYDSKHPERWGKAWGFIEDGRVSNLVPADYGKDSALSCTLMMAITRIVENISLKSRIYQG
ncbi:MAG: HAD family hydrolase [bacterium]